MIPPNNNLDKSGKPPTKHLVGMRFNKLTVVEFLGRIKKRNRWKCVCDCGLTTEVDQSNLICGRQKSCGCQKIQSTILRSTTHGLAALNIRLYHCWYDIISRCLNSKRCGYKNYGGRGITVCVEWQNSLKAFFDWSFSNGYTDSLTIDRIDNNGNYCPENCRWVSMAVQERNKRTNVLVTYKGDTLCVTDMAHKYNIPIDRLRGRLRLGWSIEKSIETPLVEKYSLMRQGISIKGMK